MSRSYSSFIPHYDTFSPTLFDDIAKTCTDSDIIVEVGAFLGHGTCYLAERLAANGKRPRFYAIDIWDEPKEFVGGEYRAGPMPWGEDIEQWRGRGGSLYDSFRFYLDGCPDKDRVYDHVQFPASTFMLVFADNSVSRVVLRYSCRCDSIKREIKEWWPKLCNEGRLYVHVGDHDLFVSSCIETGCTGLAEMVPTGGIFEMMLGTTAIFRKV